MDDDELIIDPVAARVEQLTTLIVQLTEVKDEDIRKRGLDLIDVVTDTMRPPKAPAKLEGIRGGKSEKPL